MSDNPISKIQKERDALLALARDLYALVSLGREISDPTHYLEASYTSLLADMQPQAKALLGVELGTEPICECETEITWLLRFFGVNYRVEHIQRCSYCGEHSLHIGDDWQKCMKCKRGSAQDAEGSLGTFDSQGNLHSPYSVNIAREQYFSDMM